MLQLFADQTASNTRPVGGEIALVSNNTISKGKSSRALMYCVGHSFGAHACGQAGQQGQFGRITGNIRLLKLLLKSVNYVFEFTRLIYIFLLAEYFRRITGRISNFK